MSQKEYYAYLLFTSQFTVPTGGSHTLGEVHRVSPIVTSPHGEMGLARSNRQPYSNRADVAIGVARHVYRLWTHRILIDVDGESESRSRLNGIEMDMRDELLGRVLIERGCEVDRSAQIWIAGSGSRDSTPSRECENRDRE
jgi:hypothetical protein